MIVYIPRDIEPVFDRMIKQFPVIMLMGSRGSGKTTLLKHLFSQYQYLNLELPDVRLSLQMDTKGFLERLGNPNLIVEEIQRYPDLLPYLLSRCSQSENGKIILTSSQIFRLGEDIPRKHSHGMPVLKLLPCCQHEIMRENSADRLESVMLASTFPGMLVDHQNSQNNFPEFLGLFLEKDAVPYLHQANQNKFLAFLTSLAGSAGQVINLNALSLTTGITQPTAKQWYKILLDSHLLFELGPLPESVNSRMIKTPKYFFTDTGLLCYLLGISGVENLLRYPGREYIFKNFVISEFEKFRQNDPGQNLDLSFFRDKSGREVDLIADNGSIKSAYNIRYTRTILPENFKHLVYVKDRIALENTSIIYTDIHAASKLIPWTALQNISKIVSGDIQKTVPDPVIYEEAEEKSAKNDFAEWM